MEAEQVFLEVKKCLMDLPTLTAPHAREPLTLYLSASEIAIWAVLLTDRKNLQTPIYYVSRTLTDAETSQTPPQIFPRTPNQRVDWVQSEKCAEQTRTMQEVLAYFIAEVPQNKEKECLIEQQAPIPPERDQIWSLFTDGALSGEGSGVGLRLVNPEGHEFTYAIKLDFKITNNEAEYEAFLPGLRIRVKTVPGLVPVRTSGSSYRTARTGLAFHGSGSIPFRSASVLNRCAALPADSMLIAGQINGTYESKNDMMAYLSQANDLILQFSSCKVIHIKRSENKSADALSKLASMNFGHFAKDIRVEVLDLPLYGNMLKHEQASIDRIPHID
ncbi:uncharacterized protein LOC143621415 [Bidens hawaiensis]|uniref:uncharacterized protein LOC143621415 n=1 Tax=Bidens hawaiensis TaxID=980011 RepID=UPI00404A9C8A